MKDQTITMKKTGVTNPERCGYLPFTSASSEMGDYIRKINSYKSLTVEEEKFLQKSSSFIQNIPSSLASNLK